MPTTGIGIDAAAPSGEEVLHVAQVYQEDGVVVVKWESEETKATHSTLYSVEPYFLRAFKSTGNSTRAEPTFKTFGSLLGCHGGILEIGQTHY